MTPATSTDDVGTDGPAERTSPAPELCAGDVMATHLLTVDASDGLLLTWELVSQAGVHHIPVIEQGRCLGLLAERELAVEVARNPLGQGRRLVRELIDDRPGLRPGGQPGLRGGSHAAADGERRRARTHAGRAARRADHRARPAPRAGRAGQPAASGPGVGLLARPVPPDAGVAGPDVGRWARVTVRTSSAEPAPAPAADPAHLPEEELDLLVRYWNAANYLTVAQIYLAENRAAARAAAGRRTSSRGCSATGAPRRA